MKIYRIEHRITSAGMWYDLDGTYNGIIHELKEGKSKLVPMPYTTNHLKQGKSWQSAVSSISQLLEWFTQMDIVELVEKGYGLYEIECENFTVCENEILFTRDSITLMEILDIEKIFSL